MNFKNLQKSLVMASVYEFLKSTKKVGNGLSIWISKTYQKVQKWLQYMNLKNLPKSLVIASIYEFKKSTKKFGNGFSM